MRDGFPNLCVYNEGAQDTVLVAAGPEGKVYKSTDSGLSFSTLSMLPLGGATCWRYMAIATNASMTGGPADSDVYVFGSRVMGTYYSGQLYLSMTKSSNGGLDWSEPLTICPFLSYHPEVIRAGDSLYVTFNSLVQDDGYASVYAMKSTDWGDTWSQAVMVYHRTFSNGGAGACSLQTIGDGKALITMYDASASYPDNKGVWGGLNLTDLTFAQSGVVQGDDWRLDIGFAGKLADDGRMAVGWLYRNPVSSQVDLRFGYTAWYDPWLPDGKLTVRIENGLPGMISVDGDWRTRASVESLSLAPGNHTVSFGEMPGYATPFTRTVKIMPDQTTFVNCSYEPLASVAIHTGCSNETIYIDSIPRNENSLRVYLPSGNHTISFGLIADMTPHEPIAISLAPGEHLDVVAEPTPEPGAPGPGNALGRLRVTTNPALPATLYVNGVAMNMWGIDWVKLAPGTYNLTFGELPGYTAPGSRMVTITQGEITVVQADYTRYSVLRVTTSPSSPVDISVNGVVRSSWGLWIDVAPGLPCTVTCRYGETLIATHEFVSDPHSDFTYTLVM